jgi:hypothetical protein
MKKKKPDSFGNFCYDLNEKRNDDVVDDLSHPPD